jgi:hypothetical protein
MPPLTPCVTHSTTTLAADEGIALRGLFIIDKEGAVQHATVNNLAFGRSVDETLRTLQAIQYVQSNPDEVSVPPAPLVLPEGNAATGVPACRGACRRLPAASACHALGRQGRGRGHWQLGCCPGARLLCTTGACAAAPLLGYTVLCCVPMALLVRAPPGVPCRVAARPEDDEARPQVRVCPESAACALRNCMRHVLASLSPACACVGRPVAALVLPPLTAVRPAGVTARAATVPCAHRGSKEYFSAI